MAKKSKVTKHHVPPKKPDSQPRFIVKKDRKRCSAYYLLFGDVKSFEDADAILKQDWWTDPETGSEPSCILKKERKYHEAYHLLFGNAKSYKDAAEILKHDWWTDHEKDHEP